MTQEPIQNITNNLLKSTPFGARKTAELDVQFSIDSSFGLTRERYGWYSNDVLFDSTLFEEINGEIKLETTATGTDSCRIRSAYPGQYIPHTFAEPGLAVAVPSEHIERDSNNLTSLTHGEISIHAVEWNDSTDSGENSLGLSLESDATYFQIRKGNTDIAKIPQEDWNIDPMDGTGPSGNILRPEDGLIYNFPFTWYGHGALYLSVLDTDTGELMPLHREKIDGETSLGTANLPVQLTVENQGTADPLAAKLGGLQWSTYGSIGVEDNESGRTTEITRRTSSSYIDRNVTVTDNAVDPFAQPGRPLVSVRRDENELRSAVSLSVDIINFFINSGGNLYVFIFDEFGAANALTDENFGNPEAQNLPAESRLEVDTSATDYTPGSDAVLRTMLFVAGDKNQADVIAGDSSTRMPLDSTTVVTAALPVGANSTYAQPALLDVRESF